MTEIDAPLVQTPLDAAADAGAAVAAAFLKVAHGCLSGVLQLDYLSNGAGHRQSTPLATSPDTGAKRRRARHAEGDSAGVAIDDDTGSIDPPTTIDERDGSLDVAFPSATPSDAKMPDDARTDVYTRRFDVPRRLSSTQEYRLARAAQDGDAHARDRLIEAHLGFVIMIARRYHDRGLPLQDRIEEGNIGLLTAIEKFDPEMGFRFSTYAKWWVRQAIELAMMTQCRVVHVPVYVARAMKRSSKARLATMDGSPVVASAISSASEAVGAVDDPDRRRDADLLRDVDRFLLFDASHHPGTARHDASEDAQQILDALPAPEEEQPDSRLQIVLQRHRLEAALAQLAPNERIVVRSRYGLDDDEVRTLESIAAELRISSERVRQIQGAVLPKLRRILLADGLDRDQLL